MISKLRYSLGLLALCLSLAVPTVTKAHALVNEKGKTVSQVKAGNYFKKTKQLSATRVITDPKLLLQVAQNLSLIHI